MPHYFYDYINLFLGAKTLICFSALRVLLLNFSGWQYFIILNHFLHTLSQILSNLSNWIEFKFKNFLAKKHWISSNQVSHFGWICVFFYASSLFSYLSPTSNISDLYRPLTFCCQTRNLRNNSVSVSIHSEVPGSTSGDKESDSPQRRLSVRG